MPIDQQTRALLERIVELLELPGSAYETAAQRYQSLGEFLSADGSHCTFADPHISPQGSFRLGTAIRPLDEAEAYDLDLTCSLTSGVSVGTHTQSDLKRLVGQDLAAYRKSRGIVAPLEPKHRCWRLEYQDHLSFHMDIVPSMPVNELQQDFYRDRMVDSGLHDRLAGDVAKHALNITDDRNSDFEILTPNWPVSNPEGYAQWFESRLNIGLDLTALDKRAHIDKLPIWSRKTPLQRVIQFQKRHRDNMFVDDPEVKPISVIITTIAAREYDGSNDLAVVLDTTIDALVDFALSGQSFLPNPVNPKENFADRWTMPQYAHLSLRQNFERWALQLRADFDAIVSSLDASWLSNLIEEKVDVRIGSADISRALGVAGDPIIEMPRTVRVTATQPWCRVPRR